MRKVFLSIMLLAPMNENDPTYYTSDDFDLNNKKYDFPLSYIVDNNVNENDDVVIITAVEQGKDGKVNNAIENYKKYRTEIENILKERNINISFEEIPLTTDFDSLTFNRFFKEISSLINDNDQLYVDVTFGMKPYSISMFVAVAYAEKAARNVDVDTIIYAQKYTGKKNEENISKIYDITGLFSLNTLASNAQAGQKEDLDSLLDFIID